MLKGKRMDVSRGTKLKGGTQPSFLRGQGTSGHMDTSLRPIFLVNDGGRGYLISKMKPVSQREPHISPSLSLEFCLLRVHQHPIPV